MQLEDGTLTLHQSDISTYMKCPEQFRQTNGIGPQGTIIDRPPRVESDAATVGTVLHKAIELDLDEPYTSLEALKQAARLELGMIIQGYVANQVEYRTESFGDDPANALKQLDWLVESWFNSDERDYWVHREHDSFLIENFFDIPFVQRTGHQINSIRLAGTPDIIDIQENRVLDWKSASRPYQRWEYQRWAVQPTAYTFAAADMGLIKPNGEGLYQFDYKVFIKGAKMEVQELTVLRSSGQWGWLTQVVNNIADMIESDAKTWPLRDDGWWCGPKWCPVWHSCKGAFVNEDWS